MPADTPLDQTDPEIVEFLLRGGYTSMEDWMLDSDFTFCEGCENDPEGCGWVDLDDNPVGEPEGVIEGAMEASNGFIESPSGWTYRGAQENGDNVDCWLCGNPLDDNYVILNDSDGYAYHEACHARKDAEDTVGADTPGDNVDTLAENTDYQCLNCDNPFGSADAMNAHIDAAHPDNYGD